MSKNLATRRLLGILITCVMITSCSGGTSSNTPPISRTPPPNDYVNQQRLWLLEQQRVEREREDREYRRVSRCMDNCLASTDPNCMSRCS
ncbi:hypothetical protein [Nodularia spumigena]|uniref:hypothetical protein n=1 Tax=Nodularia spumigena TaxID=70799 RepID=UPI002B1EEBBA|nr:hypothetical protein [Nodularia spumigena]MEA5556288.1 hypothetical protein [Nodularia spumigena CH309]